VTTRVSSPEERSATVASRVRPRKGPDVTTTGDLRAVLLGPPGAGKGTQAARLSERYDVPHIATGDIFRANVSEGTDLGREAKRYMDAGELVPDEIVIGMVRDHVRDSDADGFLLDGFPRTVPQADALHAFLDELGRPLHLVLHLRIDDNEVVRRIAGRRVCVTCGATYHVDHDPPDEEGACDRCGGEVIHRDDDQEDVVRNRLQVYRDETAPLEAHYDDLDLLTEVDAVGSLEEVTERAVDAIERALTADDGTAA
jgi:adenylate kinase